MLTIFFATSFTTALQRVYLHAWRRPPRAGAGAYWRGLIWLLVVLAYMALLGASARRARRTGSGSASSPSSSLAVTSALWWFTAWFLLLGDVRARVLVPTGVITGIAMAGVRSIGHDLDARPW